MSETTTEPAKNDRVKTVRKGDELVIDGVAYKILSVSGNRVRLGLVDESRK